MVNDIPFEQAKYKLNGIMIAEVLFFSTFVGVNYIFIHKISIRTTNEKIKRFCNCANRCRDDFLLASGFNSRQKEIEGVSTYRLPARQLR